MTPREIIKAQINHQETCPVPYTLGFEAGVSERLDEHYGSSDWRQQLTQYMVRVSAVDTDIRQPVGERYSRDGYGGVWRVDQVPWHLETPPLATPTLQGYDFPQPEVFLIPLICSHCRPWNRYILCAGA